MLKIDRLVLHLPAGSAPSARDLARRLAERVGALYRSGVAPSPADRLEIRVPATPGANLTTALESAVTRHLAAGRGVR